MRPISQKEEPTAIPPVKQKIRVYNPSLLSELLQEAEKAKQHQVEAVLHCLPYVLAASCYSCYPYLLVLSIIACCSQCYILAWQLRAPATPCLPNAG